MDLLWDHNEKKFYPSVSTVYRAFLVKWINHLRELISSFAYPMGETMGCISFLCINCTLQ
jgi:hypothetical protein